MPVFALTGNFGCGKSAVLALLGKKGASTFDCDARVYRYYLLRRSGVYQRIARAFPEAVTNGVISRKKVASIVFKNTGKLRLLEKILHPVIIKDLRNWVNSSRGKNKVSVAEVPLLFEKKLQNYFDAVILVIANNSAVEQRLCSLGLSKNEATKRRKLFLPIKKKIKHADFIINNSVEIQILRKNIDSLWSELKKYK